MTDTAPPAALFDLVGQEARMAILRALLVRRRDSADPYLAFSDLQRRAGIDDTGRFNYHLGELEGTLVTKTDDGYRLTEFGFRVLAPLATGFYDPDASVDGIDVPGECHVCGGPVRVELSDGVLAAVCTEGHTVNEGLVGYPGLVADRSPGEARTALGLLNTHAAELGTAGVCPLCHGPTRGEVEWIPAAECYAYRAPCEACGNRFVVPVGGCIGTHHAVVARYAEAAVDVRRTVPWRHPFRRVGAEEVVSEDPLRLGLLVGEELPGESLYVTVDRDGDARSIVRIPGDRTDRGRSR